MSDIFDIIGRNMTAKMISVLRDSDRLPDGPFKSGVICGIEELYARITKGKFMDWQTNREALLGKARGGSDDQGTEC